MANKDQLKIILEQGVEAWNKWRIENHDEIDLRGADLNGKNLKGANLYRANLLGAKFAMANLSWADLSLADLSWANLSGADLIRANLWKADLHGADLTKADLSGADLSKASITITDLSAADLSRASLVEATFVRTKLTGCRIYGISAWGLKMDDKTEQRDLIITPHDQPTVTVDDVEVAQFVYLLIDNQKIRNVIDTIAKKAVLILGRFTPERKAVLNALRTELHNKGYLPIIFDFDKPTTKDFTETIRILAGMSLFVIADISNPKSSPLELQATVPDYMVPFVPIIQKGEEPFSMFKDLYIKHKKWVLAPLVYNSVEGLISILDTAIIKPAERVHKEILMEKAAELPLRYEGNYKIGDNKAS